MTMKVRDFLDAMSGYTAAQQGQKSSDKPNKLAVIDPSYPGSGFPKVTFEGESVLSARQYAVLGSYQPVASDRVILIPVGTGYAIIGKVAVPTAISAFRPWSYVSVSTAFNASNGSVLFQNSWTNYDGGTTFNPAGFMIDAKGKVRLRGLVANATSGQTGTIFVLPAAYRPDIMLSFKGYAAVLGSVAEIRVLTTGEVQINGYGIGGNAGNISLDEVTFFPALANIPWTYITTFANSWANYGNGFPGARYYVDVDGIVHWSGMVAGGTVNTTGGMFSIPAAAQSFGVSNTNSIEIYCALALGGSVRLDFSTVILPEIYNPGGGGNTYVSLEGIEYVAANSSVFVHVFGTLSNSWIDYNGGYAPLSWSIDSAGIVRWRGLISSGTVGTKPHPFFPYAYICPFDTRITAVATDRMVLYDCNSATSPPGPAIVGYSTGGGNTYVSVGGVKWPINA